MMFCICDHGIQYKCIMHLLQKSGVSSHPEWPLSLSISYLIQENPCKRCTVSGLDEANHISNAPL